MVKRLLLVALLATCALFGGLHPVLAGELNVGDSAPKLEVKEFVKGNPVTSFEKGKTYVVEFWATWCGPCRVSIPHITELQKKFKDVTFIGVSVWESNQALVKPFVEKMGPKMDYTVAMDVVTPGAKGSDGIMAKSWMEAAAQNGIPAAFVVNGSGKVAWVGHPMELEKPLSEVVAGTWDVQKAAVAFKEQITPVRQLDMVNQDYMAARKANDLKKALEVLNSAIATMPKLETSLGMAKYNTLIDSGDTVTAQTYGKHLVEDVLKDNPGALNEIAWSIVDPQAKVKPTKDQLALALTAAKHADDLTGNKEPAIEDTLGKAYFDNGDVAAALATQQKAVANAKRTAMAKDPDILSRLALYQASAAKTAVAKQ